MNARIQCAVLASVYMAIEKRNLHLFGDIYLTWKKILSYTSLISWRHGFILLADSGGLKEISSVSQGKITAVDANGKALFSPFCNVGFLIQVVYTIFQ
jgi:hypothetical protein